MTSTMGRIEGLPITLDHWLLWPEPTVFLSCQIYRVNPDYS